MMKEFEEIQKIVKNFVEESKQVKQQISEIENERNNLAQKRNEKKEANIEENIAEINVLGKQISKLGNQSQELQNKLDKRFFEVKKLVNLMIDNKITEEMRKIRKIDEIKQDYLGKIAIQKDRKAKYELQKEEFYQRFGRMPEITKNAKIEDEIQDKQCEKYKVKIQEKQELIENSEEKLAELVNFKSEFLNKNWSNIIGKEDKIEEESTVLPLIEEIEIEEIEPIQEVEVEEFQPIEEINIEGFEVKPFEIEEQPQESNIEKIEEKQTNEIDEIEELARAIVEQIVEEQTKQQEIVAYEEEKIDIDHINDNITGEPALLSSIMIKIENNEIVYKAQANNGEEVTITPTKTENAYLRIKEKTEKIKEALINYAVVEYRPLDKNVIKKIDPIVCELLNKFAEKYNYDVGMLIYNYAMSFAKNEMIRTEFASITYNLAYINEANLSKTEKREILKICKKANRNENIDVIGQNFSFGKIKYIFKRLFAINGVDRLPEGKY